MTEVHLNTFRVRSEQAESGEGVMERKTERAKGQGQKELVERYQGCGSSP